MPTRSLNVAITGDARSLNRMLDQTEGRTKRFSANVTKGFVAVGAAAAGALTVGLTKGVKAAVDIEESLTKNEQLFGQHAKTIERFASSSARSFGVSRQAALEATGQFGAIFEALKIGDKPAADMSVRLTKLAADLGSFNNASPKEALEALRSGLSGEAEPMRRFNAFLSEGRVKAEAYASGIAKTGTELTESQKIQARYALILKDTEKAHGDYAKTSGSLANQQRTLAAVWSDIAGRAGKTLLPALAKVATASLNASDAVGRAWPKVRNAVGTAIDAVTGFLRRFRNRNREDLEAVAGAARNVAKAVRYAFEEVIVPVVRVAVRALSRVLENVVQVLRGVVRLVSGVLTGDWKKAWQGAKDIASGAVKGVINVVRGAGSILLELAKRLGAQIIRGVVAGLKGLANAVKNGIVNGFKAGIREAGKILDKINPLSSITGNIVNDAGDAGKGIAGSIPGGAFLGVGGGGNTNGLQIEARTGLNFLRQRYGGLTLSSGRRSPAENARVGGASNSDHLTGLGTDIVPAEGWTFAGINRLDRIAAWARKSPLIRWIGWRGVKGHGPGDHLHLSWVDRMKGDVKPAAGMSGRHPKERVIGLGGGGAGDTVPQIRNLWTRAGGRASAADLAAAVAMAESGGDPRAFNRNSNGSVDRGLWQINSVHGGLSTFDRLANARAAVRISGNGSNWRPWVAFTNGSYRRFLTSGGGGGGGGGGASSGGAAARARFVASQRATSNRAAGRAARARTYSPVRWGPQIGRPAPAAPTPWWEQEIAGGGEPDPAAEALRLAIEAQTRATEEHTTAVKGLEAEVKRSNDIAAAVQTSSGFQAEKFLADLLSNKIARGVVGRSFTPGTGVAVAY